jgi:hypothetical protein
MKDPGFNSWYPSCVIKLTIRFDETMQVTGSGEGATARAQAGQTQEGRITGNERKQGAKMQYPLFRTEGPSVYFSAYAYNRRYAVDPPWVSTLSAEDEVDFRVWVAQNRVPFDPDADTVDYDMRGYWHDFIKPGGRWVAGHFPDTWKTPYDATFSAESKYAIASCPNKWNGDRLINTDTGQLIFGPPIQIAGKESGRELATKKHRPRRGLTEPTDATAQQNAALADQDELHVAPTAESPTPGSAPVDPRSGARSTDAPTTATVPVTFGTDGFTVICNRVPKRGSFTLPHPRSAATFNLTLDYHEFPIDPRLIRAVGVEVHIGAVSAEDYARGMAGEKDTDGRPLSVLKTTSGLIDPWSGRPSPNDATLLFYGVVDTWEVDHSETGSTIALEGRDIRSLFIDAKVPLEKMAKVDLTKPINVVVESIIKTMGHEHDLRMNIMTDAAEWPDGKVPVPGDVDGLTRVRLGASGEKTSATPATGTKTSYWDLITNYCTLVGGIPQFQGSTLWIRPSHRVFDVLNQSLATPFAGGKSRQVGTEQIRARRLVFGRDIKRLRFQRKFQGTVVPTIQTISHDDRASGKQRLIFGQWPPETTAQAQAKAEGELLRVPQWGVRSVKQLTEIARGIYEEIGRGEVGGTADTQNLASYGGDNSDPDMLRLRPMEPVEFVIDARALNTIAPVVHELNDQNRRSFSEEVEILYRRLGDRAVARALAAMARGAIPELLSFYQVIQVQYDWGQGLKTSIQFQNYIVPRHQANRDGITTPDLKRTRVDIAGAQRKAIESIRGVTAVALTALAAARSAQIGEGLANGGGDFYGDGEGSEATAPAPSSLTRRYRRLGETDK